MFKRIYHDKVNFNVYINDTVFSTSFDRLHLNFWHLLICLRSEIFCLDLVLITYYFSIKLMTSSLDNHNLRNPRTVDLLITN